MEDQALTRDGFKYTFDRPDSNFKIVGEASNGKELLELLLHKTADLILLDHEMPMMNGMETILILKEKYPHIKVIAWTFYSNESLFHYYHQNGVSAYLEKGGNYNLAEVMKEVFEKGKYIFEGHYKWLTKAKTKNELYITAREMDVLRLICAGRNTKEISIELCIQDRTVNTHLNFMYLKTNTKTTAGLVAYALSNGIVLRNSFLASQ